MTFIMGTGITGSAPRARVMRLMAVIGILAFLSVPVGPGVREQPDAARWLNNLIGYVR
jgi:hypothetical protein